MGRSVAKLYRAKTTVYFDTSYIKDSWEWQDFYENLIYQLTNKFKSLYKDERHGDYYDGDREVLIFLENQLVEIGISEYCGITSLSYRFKENDNYGNAYQENFSKNPKLIKAYDNFFESLSDLKTFCEFPNGEAFYISK